MQAVTSRRGALQLLGAAALAVPARADDRDLKRDDLAQDDLARDVERAFRPLLARHDVPGLMVAVTVAGRRSFFPFGVASRRTGAPVGSDTLFEIGSISKVFAATLAAQAEASGVLSLEARVAEFVPELRGAPVGQASLLHLATYTAGGLPLQFPEGVASEATALAYFRRWTPQAAPGAQRRYSNPSIVLLGLAIARALGRDMAEAMEGELLPGLGLRRSLVRTPAAAEMERYASGYDGSGRPIRLRPGTFAAAAYGVRATAADMLAFLEANLRADGLEPRLRSAVLATHPGRFRVGPMVQGLGWERYPDPVPLDRLLAGNAAEMARSPQAATRLEPPLDASEPALFNKTGSTNGFGAYAVFVPARRLGLVMLANRALPIPERVAAAHAVLTSLAGA